MAIHICRDEDEEARELAGFFAMLKAQQISLPIWTFNGLRYDLWILQLRAMELGLVAPRWDIRNYSTDRLVDLYDLYGGNVQRDRVMKCDLDTLCRRYHIPHDNGVLGKDVARLWAEGQHDLIAQHCADDIQATIALAHKKGLFGPAVCVDIETLPIDGADQFFPEPEANKTLKDPEKIAADLAKKRKEQAEYAGVDIHLARICVLGYEVLPAERDERKREVALNAEMVF